MTTRTHPVLSRLAGALVLAGCMSAPAAHALDVTWIDTVGNWSEGAKWSPGLPAAGDNVLITNPGSSVTFDSAADLTYGSMNLGVVETVASLWQSANPLSFSGQVTLGSASGENGMYDLSGGLLSASDLFVGGRGIGTLLQSGGVVRVGVNPDLSLQDGLHELIVSRFEGAAGTYGLSGSGVLHAKREIVGDAGYGWHSIGTFDQSGSSTHKVYEDLIAGQDPMSSGTFNLSESASLTVLGTVFVGDEGGAGSFQQSGTSTLSTGRVVIGARSETGPGGSGASSGDFFQDGGSHTVAGDLVLGDVAGTTGYYALSGGTLAVGGSEYVGYAGSGTFDQYSGTHTVAGNLYVDATPASKGTFNLSGGTLDVAGSTLVGNNAFASGSFNHDGGSHTVANDLVLGVVADSTGYYKLSGTGSLTVQVSTTIGEAGSGSFTQDGGTFTQYGGYGALVLGGSAGGAGTYTLNGGLLDVQGNEEYIGNSGTGTFYQFGGEHRFSGGLYVGTGTGGVGAYHMAGGLITNAKVDAESNPIYAGIVLGEWAATGSFFHSGGTVNADSVSLARQAGSTGYYEMSGAGAVLNTNWLKVGERGSGTFTHYDGSVNVTAGLDIGVEAGVSGSYDLHGGSLNTSGPVVVGNAGTGTFRQYGGTHTNTGGIILGLNAGSLGTYELRGGTFSGPPGGWFTVNGPGAGGSPGNGKFLYSGGTFDSNLWNYGHVEFSGAGTRVVNGSAVNAAGATMLAHATQVEFTGTFTNHGAYVSDPSINTFADLIVGETGYLAGGPGDQFRVAGDFTSSSTQNMLWDTQNAQLIFIGDKDHSFSITGADLGPTTAGYAHNFGWGDFQLDLENVYLQDGNATAGGALYVGTIFGLDIVGGTVQNLHGNGLNVYYIPDANPGLGGLSYALADGGTLAPVPEPGGWALLLSGLALLGVVAKRRG